MSLQRSCSWLGNSMDSPWAFPTHNWVFMWPSSRSLPDHYSSSPSRKRAATGHISRKKMKIWLLLLRCWWLGDADTGYDAVWHVGRCNKGSRWGVAWWIQPLVVASSSGGPNGGEANSSSSLFFTTQHRHSIHIARWPFLKGIFEWLEEVNSLTKIFFQNTTLGKLVWIKGGPNKHYL